MLKYFIDGETSMISTEWQDGETLENLVKRIKLAAASIETSPDGTSFISMEKLLEAQLKQAAKMIFGESE